MQPFVDWYNQTKQIATFFSAVEPFHLCQMSPVPNGTIFCIGTVTTSLHFPLLELSTKLALGKWIITKYLVFKCFSHNAAAICKIVIFMERHFWIWAFLILFLVLGSQCFGCFDEERVALLQLKASFCSPDCSSFPAWEDEETDCCGWERVECSNRTGRVLKLFLNNTRSFSHEALYLNASLFVPFMELKLLNLSTNMLSSLGDDVDDGINFC